MNRQLSVCKMETMMVMGTIAPLTVTLAVAMTAMTAMLLLVQVLWKIPAIASISVRDGSITSVDTDGDGFSVPIDCDDSDATVNPDADEYCDGVDNNCDGLTDEEDSIDATIWYIDVNSDGYGEDNTFNELSCEQPDGYVDNADDCEPFDAESYPSATEIPDDGIDQDCDGSDTSSSSPEEPSSEPSEEPGWRRTFR